MCCVFQSQIKEAGGQIKLRRSRATVLGELFLFARTREGKEQDLKKRKKGENKGRQMCSHFLQLISSDPNDPLLWQQHRAYVRVKKNNKKTKPARLARRFVIAGENPDRNPTH